MSHNTRTLLTVAAELRAAGASWEAVASKVRRQPRTCKSWPNRFRDDWLDLYRDAQARRFQETSEEAHALLRNTMRSQDMKVRLKAIEIWLKNGAAAYGVEGSMNAPRGEMNAPRGEAADRHAGEAYMDEQLRVFREGVRPGLDNRRALQGLPPATEEELAREMEREMVQMLDMVPMPASAAPAAQQAPATVPASAAPVAKPAPATATSAPCMLVLAAALAVGVASAGTSPAARGACPELQAR